MPSLCAGCIGVWTLTSSMMDLFSFRVPSMLWTGTGFGKGWVSSLCFWTKAWLMNIPVVLESRRVDVEMDHREVVVQSSMAMLRAWADFVMNHAGLCHTSHTSRFCDTF